VESLQEGEEEKHVLTEGELRGLKKELRQLQRKAEGTFQTRGFRYTRDIDVFLLDDNLDPSKLTAADLVQNVSASNKLFEKCTLRSRYPSRLET
jgi:hypothetical protein